MDEYIGHAHIAEIYPELDKYRVHAHLAETAR